MKPTNSQIGILARVGVEKCLEAADLARRGYGCNTVGFMFGMHWKTASAAMDIGRMLPSVREI